MADNLTQKFADDQDNESLPLRLKDIGSVLHPVSILCDSAGTLWDTVPISAASLPLPTGAATAANQSTSNTSLASIDGKITACNTGAVVVSSSALPSGAATSAKQDTAQTALDAIKTADEATAAAQGTTTDAAATAGGAGTVSAKLRTLTSQLSTQAGYLDGIETLLGGLALETGGNLAASASGIGATGDSSATVGGTGSINAKLRLVTTQLNTLAGYLDGVESALSPLALESGGNLAAAASGIGATTDAAATTGGAGSVSAKLRLVTTQLNTQAGYLDGIEAALAQLATESTLGLVNTVLNEAIVGSSQGVNKGISLLASNLGSTVFVAADSNGRLDTLTQGKAAHDAALTGISPILMGGYASAAAPSDVSADGDAVRLWALRNGSQVCNLAVGGTLVTGSAGLPVAQQGTWNTGTVTTLTGSGIAHDAADSGNPHKIGAKATTSLSGKTMVSNDDRSDLFCGVDGVQIMRPHCNLEDIVSGVAAITDGSSTSVISAAGSGVKIYITSVVISNSSATAVTVDLRDGTGGSVKATFPVPANTGGVVCNLPVPIPFSANTAVAADPSAAASTVTVSLIGFKSKV